MMIIPLLALALVLVGEYGTDAAAVRASVVLRWPAGTYGLLMPKKSCASSAGRCPSGNWEEGSRYHDSEDKNNDNKVSSWSCLEGFVSKRGIEWHFCMKETNTGGQNWPKGKYCIFKKGSCPSGFHSGFMYFDDENSNNANRKWSHLPDGIYTSNTRYEFCCRHDGPFSTYIRLPTERPFYLFPTTNSCQRVSGMTARKELLYFDDEDSGNRNSRSFLSPTDRDRNNNHNLVLCYYRRR